MWWIHTSQAGTQSSCQAVIIVLVGSLLYLMVSASPEVRGPSIVEPQRNTRMRNTTVGQRLIVTCKADPGFPDDFTLIYWLVNRTFIETSYPDGRIHEAEERNLEQDGKALIQRDLIFEKVAKEDLRASYTCVVNSPAGRDVKTVYLYLQDKRKKGWKRGKVNSILKSPKIVRRRQESQMSKASSL